MDGGEVTPRKPQSGEEKMDIMKSSEQENPMMRLTFTISEQHFLATIHQLTGKKKKKPLQLTCETYRLSLDLDKGPDRNLNT